MTPPPPPADDPPSESRPAVPWWEETPAEAARYDRAYWTDRYDEQ